MTTNIKASLLGLVDMLIMSLLLIWIVSVGYRLVILGDNGFLFWLQVWGIWSCLSWSWILGLYVEYCKEV